MSIHKTAVVSVFIAIVAGYFVGRSTGPVPKQESVSAAEPASAAQKIAPQQEKKPPPQPGDQLIVDMMSLENALVSASGDVYFFDAEFGLWVVRQDEAMPVRVVTTLSHAPGSPTTQSILSTSLEQAVHKIKVSNGRKDSQ